MNNKGKLNTVTQTMVNGPVYALTTVAKDKVVAAVFSSVHVFNFHEGTLTQECVFDGCILALFLKSMGDFVLVSTSGCVLVGVYWWACTSGCEPVGVNRWV